MKVEELSLKLELIESKTYLTETLLQMTALLSISYSYLGCLYLTLSRTKAVKYEVVQHLKCIKSCSTMQYKYL